MEYARYTAQQETMHDLRCMVHGAHTAHDRISIPTPPSYQADTHCSQSTKKLQPYASSMPGWSFLSSYCLISYASISSSLSIYFKIVLCGYLKIA